MAPPRQREILRGVTIFALLVLIGSLPSRAIESGFSHALSVISNAGLSGLSFPGGIRAELSPLPASALARGENVKEDTRLVLRAPAHGTSASLGLSLRRDAFLPLVIFLAAILALPLAIKKKAACIAIGVPAVVAVAVASIWILVARLTSHLPGAQASDLERTFSAFMFERWLTPPGNRVIAPAIFAAGLSALVHRYWPISFVSSGATSLLASHAPVAPPASRCNPRDP